jgi:hypothetical protein
MALGSGYAEFQEEYLIPLIYSHLKQIALGGSFFGPGVALYKDAQWYRYEFLT